VRFQAGAEAFPEGPNGEPPGCNGQQKEEGSCGVVNEGGGDGAVDAGGQYPS
jgi:hypothetical protein